MKIPKEVMTTETCIPLLAMTIKEAVDVVVMGSEHATGKLLDNIKRKENIFRDI
jgi:hypothetical protein